jgi:hypothetical protein
MRIRTLMIIWLITIAPLSPATWRVLPWDMAAAQSIEVTPARLDFGNVVTGTNSEQSLTIRNTGDAVLTVSSITSTNERFTVLSPRAPFQVRIGGQQPVRLQFSSTSLGMQTGLLQINSNDSLRSMVAIPLQGRGVEELSVDDGTFETAIGLNIGGKACAVNRLTPTSYPTTLVEVAIFFKGDVNVGIGSPLTVLVGVNPMGGPSIDGISFRTVNVTVRSLESFNVSAVPDVTINSGDFLVGFCMDQGTDNYPLALDETPPSQRRSYASVDGGVSFILIDDLGFPDNLGVRARVVQAVPDIDILPPDLLDFGGVVVGQTKELPLTVRNLGTAPLRINSISRNNPQFSQFNVVSPLGPFTVAPGAQQEVKVRFSPTSLGPHTDALTFDSNDPDEPSVTTSLQGTGIPSGMPDLIVKDLAVSSINPARGDTVSVSFSIMNQGTATAGTATHYVVLSRDATIDASDRFLAAVTTSNLPAGGSSPIRVTALIPPDATAGTQFIGVIADVENTVMETNETNNTAAVMINVRASSAMQVRSPKR